MLSTSVLLLLTAIPGTWDDVNSLTDAESKAGWTLLFDGQETDHWRNYKKDNVSDGWEVKDGALVRSRRGAGDIITRKKYKYFELSLEYKISKGGNSGIMFHVTEEYDRPWQTGPEIQVQDNVDGHDPQKSGWLYQLYRSPQDATRPAGEWNEVRLRIAPDNCEIQMNGVRYARFKLGSRDWNRRVAASKFAKFENFGKAGEGHICLQDHGNEVAYRNIKIRELTPGQAINPVDGQLKLKPVLAFPKLQFAEWSPEDEGGKQQPLRPIILTHSGDGSNRVFVATQRGVIHVFDNDRNASKTKVFLDISDRVIYKDSQNEEGLLGVAFHPKFKQNGELYIYYTTRSEPNTSVISRFKVSKEDPDKALADSEVEIMRLKQPYWNHNGGTIAFGPDGYLYIGLGDGGSANDPKGNGQNLSTLLGSILRIDVDRPTTGARYSVPSDNPFVNTEGARPEIWAYGLRNVWRLAFDRKTGHLWAADVGQNLWEEINIIEKGGNYGWNYREAAHPFGRDGKTAGSEFIDPVWEYDHEIGKSITGGYVYRGSKLPELTGCYVYGDYVSGHLWALKYDTRNKTVGSNLSIPSDGFQVISFGEDEKGEIYIMVVSATGRGIYTLEKAD